MTAIVIRRYEKPKKAGRKPKGVTERLLTTDTGETVRVRAIDANSPTFGDDFLYVFSRNVAAARRENKAVLGTPSGVKKPG